MICKHCGERMEGDGYKVVFHCPSADEERVASAEPDANPIECNFDAEKAWSRLTNDAC